MHKSVRNLDTIVANPWFVVACGMSNIAAFMWFIYGRAINVLSPISTATLVVALFLLSLVFIYSIKIRAENIALRGISEVFYEINLLYQEKLRELFCSDAPVSDAEELLAEEELALKAICQRISTIYSRVISRNCMVTVKLVTSESGKVYAHTYVRSQELCFRDYPERIRYSVGTGENIGFDIALAKRSESGIPSHFYSADLRKPDSGQGYTNARPNYLQHYKSALVVPICGRIKAKDVMRNDLDLIGFLSVDTLSVNRLNNNYHLYILSSLATQMYNFMSLMRGKYTVSVVEKVGEINGAIESAS